MKERWHLEQYVKDTTATMTDTELIKAVLERVLKEVDRILDERARK